MLITGFEGYGGRGINPSQEIVRALDGTTIGGATVVGRVLPVEHAPLRRAVRDLVEELRPPGVICLGLWPGEPVIRLERLAVNLHDFEIPDNVGERLEGEIVPGAVAARMATLPVGEIRDRLLAAGIPARLSSSAGNFLCNAVLYHVLTALEEVGHAVPCGFVHVPYLPRQVAELIAAEREAGRLELHQRADLASMSLDLMVEAVRVAVETTLESAR